MSGIICFILVVYFGLVIASLMSAAEMEDD